MSENAYELLVSILSAALLLLSVTAPWRIFTKIGRHGWEALIPIYNIVVFFSDFWGSGWFVLLLCIPYLSILTGILSLLILYHRFGKGILFSIFGLLFPPIAVAILAFGPAEPN